jgi:hypothetical protein
MKNKFQIASVMLLIMVACSKGQLATIKTNTDSVSSGKSFSTNRSSNIIIANVPDCILKKINDAILANGNNKGLGLFKISEYLYQGKKVYTITSGFPDSGTPVYDQNCINICYIGGFIITATNLCNGEVFFDKAQKLRDLYTY